MAFNFNWSPLIADTSRARDMLTSALNKSPKPPIIVDDIVVTELNLGTIPPELEILEIGDLAEDRFRGIFKMSYTGDAFLTLKTKVQANPLNTYLSTKPSFASPQPLAAASGLTIPLAITLSDIKLSGFVILVFSKQKGITLVFRNDPLESLKVSSTFDSIPFVRDYLQKEIEEQLRNLFMEDLPAIIHRLSLRLWVPEHASKEEEEASAVAATEKNIIPVDPLASPPQNASDDTELETVDIAALSVEHHVSGHFSQKNLLRLAALTDSHRTLSLFTPPIRDSVFRAWACSPDSRELSGHIAPGFSIASLQRYRSPTATSLPGSATISPTDYSSSRRSSLKTSSSFASLHSATSMAGSKPRRKRKRRIVDLRKQKPTEEVLVEDIEEHGESRSTTPTSTERSSQSAFASDERSQHREGELVTPPDSPEKKLNTTKPKMQTVDEKQEIASPQPRPARSPFTGKQLQRLIIDDGANDLEATPRANPPQRPLQQDQPSLQDYWPRSDAQPIPPVVSSGAQPERPRMYPHHFGRGDKHQQFPRREQGSPLDQLAPPYSFPDNANAGQGASTHDHTPFLNPFAGPSTGSILEQAWMIKMATEIARKVAEERASSGSQPVPRTSSSPAPQNKRLARLHDDVQDAEVEHPPPPAYAA